MTTLLWLRDDLRTHDHEALSAACAASREHGGGVVALWLREAPLEDDDGDRLGPRPLGAATRWWYHRSLVHLQTALAELGIPLVFAAGDPREVVPRLARELGATAVRWSRRYAGPSRDLDARVKTALTEQGTAAHSHPGHLLVEPWHLSTAAGGHYRVFTPFHRAAQAVEVGAPLPAPAPPGPVGEAVEQSLSALRDAGHLVALDELGLLDQHPQWWADTVALHWAPGQAAARAQLADARVWLSGYGSSHDVPGDEDSTSRLSPRLRSGELSVRTVLHAAGQADVPAADRGAWVRQLHWREFSWHLTYHLRHLERDPMRAQFRRFPYEPDAELARAWQQGRTGIGLVDAGMLQLWHSGWMHNRVRMVTASFLTKNLLQPWWDGEAWFWDTLVDADEANNPVSWQWVAGCGADAAPYFRVFNPELQREKFDPRGEYTSRWLAFDEGPPAAPVVDLAASRREALEAYEVVRSGTEDQLP